MSWVRLDHNFPDHPKVLQIGPLAIVAHVRAICYSARHLTDGAIPKQVLEAILDDLEELGVHSESERQTFVQQMLDSGLWEQAENGIIVHDYLDYNPSREDILKLRKARAKAGRIGGQASAKQRAGVRGQQ